MSLYDCQPMVVTMSSGRHSPAACTAAARSTGAGGRRRRSARNDRPRSPRLTRRPSPSPAGRVGKVNVGWSLHRCVRVWGRQGYLLVHVVLSLYKVYM